MSGIREYVAYFDESGTHDEAPVLILGGLLGTTAEFAKLKERLDAISASYGFEIYHAVDVKHGKGVFRGWSPQKKLQIAAEYSNLIEESLTAAAAASLVKEDYRTVYRADQGHRKAPKDSAYGLCFRICLIEFLQTIEEAGGYKTAPYRLSITVEDGARNVEDARRIFEETRSTALTVIGVDPLGSFSILGKTECRELMLADFLAYTEFMRYGQAEVLEGIAPEEIEAITGIAPAVRKAKMFRASLDRAGLGELQSHLARLKRARSSS
jgi:Protein of unknown function (DUF3800)